MREVRVSWAALSIILLPAVAHIAAALDDEPPPRLIPCAESACLRLYVDETTAEIVVWDKRHAVAWHSNPPDRGSDPLANDLNRALLGSQLRVEIYTPKDQLLEFNSQANSVEKRIFSISRVEDGVRVEYKLNNFERGEADIPLAVAKRRFEKRFLEQMDEEQRRRFMSRYALDEERGLYIRGSIPRYELESFLEILDHVGYSSAELAEDNAAAGKLLEDRRGDPQSRIPGIRSASLSQKDELEIFIPIEYRLKGEDLVVRIDATQIGYHQNYALFRLEVLRFFGAAGSNESGYLLIPDGCGALIYLNNGKHNYLPVSLPIYGDQEAELQTERLHSAKQVYLPVFGLKSGEKAFIAVIEEGEAIASINADVSRRLNSYNSIGAEFHLMEKGRVTIGTGERARSRFIFPKMPYRGEIRIRYSFLYGEEANYLGMANRLQEYLRTSRAVESVPSREPLFNLQLIGAIDLPRRFAGRFFGTVKAMTSYRQVVELADRILIRGIDNLRIRYSGWMKNGLHHWFPKKIRLEKNLGGEEGFRYMLGELNRRGVQLWPEISVGLAYLTGDGFVARKHAERYLNQSVARSYSFDLATFQRDQEAPAGYFVAPSLIKAAVTAAVDFAVERGIDGVVLGQLGSQLRADYRSALECNRQQARNLVETTLNDASRRIENLAVSGANFPVIAAVDQLYDLPFSSSEFNICDESIPFLQLVLRGQLRFTGEPLNLAADYRELFLKTLETDADLLVLWTFEKSSGFKNTNFDRYYATNYQASLERAVGLYNELRDVRTLIGASRLVAHQQIQPKVYELVFENGIVLVLNYNRRMIMYKGRAINGQGYLIIEQDG